MQNTMQAKILKDLTQGILKGDAVESDSITTPPSLIQSWCLDLGPPTLLSASVRHKFSALPGQEQGQAAATPACREEGHLTGRVSQA